MKIQALTLLIYLIGGVLAFGGQYRPTPTTDTTHLVTLSPSSTTPTSTSKSVRIILPHYFDDCFKMRLRVLNERVYTFPSPPLLTSSSLPILDPLFSLKDKDKDAVDFERPFEGHKVYIAVSDCEAETDLGVLKSGVCGLGGTLVNSWDVQTVTIAIFGARKGFEYVQVRVSLLLFVFFDKGFWGL
jgi:hypothetical protein